MIVLEELTDMWIWVDRSQAEYVMVPMPILTIEIPDKDQAMEKILDLTMLTDILPTGFTERLWQV
jgi:glutathione-independent formaldehyde dehydrogenase